MQMTLRKVDLDGREYFELNGKLTYDRWMQANDVFDSIKGKTVTGTRGARRASGLRPEHAYPDGEQD